MLRGVVTRHTSGWRGNGLIYIGFISGGGFHRRHDRFSAEHPARCSCGQTLLSEGIALAGPSPTESHQRGWQPVVPEGHFRTEADRGTRSALSLSACPVPEQHRGTGPSGHQTPSAGMSGIPGLSFGMANASGNRDDEHDPQGTSEVVGEGRHRWSGCIHRTSPGLDERVIGKRVVTRSRCLIQDCNTSIKIGRTLRFDQTAIQNWLASIQGKVT